MRSRRHVLYALRTHDGPASLRCRRSGLSGILLGTYSAVAPAALCSVARHVRPLRCGFATEDCGAEAPHGACPVKHYATAPLSSTPWPAGCMELTWRIRIWRRR
jgi:hypothetical protein